MKSYGEKLVEFLKLAIKNDPICRCGCVESAHSDDGFCYGCLNCDCFNDANGSTSTSDQIS